MKAAVKVKNLTKSFGKEKVLKGISHTFEAGKIHGIMGFNGYGKTVMFKCICGFLQPDRGSVYVYGKRIGKDIDFPENTGMIKQKYFNNWKKPFPLTMHNLAGRKPSH